MRKIQPVNSSICYVFALYEYKNPAFALFLQNVNNRNHVWNHPQNKLCREQYCVLY